MGHTSQLRVDTNNVSNITNEDNRNIMIDKPALRGITISGIDSMNLQIMKKRTERQLPKNTKKRTPGRMKRNTPLAPSSGRIESTLLGRKLEKTT